MDRTKSGIVIALTAAGLFAAACKKEEKKGADPAPASGTASASGAASASASGAAGQTAEAAGAPSVTNPVAPNPGEKVTNVDCLGVNECKGQGSCRTASHGCGGQNECKGKGVIKIVEAECAEKGGKVTQRYP